MILRMMGGKRKVARDLLSLAPRRYSEFRDIFCANASLLWVVPTTKKRWINDLNPDIVRIHRALQGNPEFIDRVCRLRDTLTTADRLLRHYWQSKFDLLFGSEFEQTVAYWFLSRVAWGQFVRRERPNIASFSWRHYRNGIHPVTRCFCHRARNILQGVRITQGDYSVPLFAPGEDVFLLIDPPYFVDHHCSPLYEKELTLKQHRLRTAQAMRKNAECRYLPVKQRQRRRNETGTINSPKDHCPDKGNRSTRGCNLALYRCGDVPTDIKNSGHGDHEQYSVQLPAITRHPAFGPQDAEETDRWLTGFAILVPAASRSAHGPGVQSTKGGADLDPAAGEWS